MLGLLYSSEDQAFYYITVFPNKITVLQKLPSKSRSILQKNTYYFPVSMGCGFEALNMKKAIDKQHGKCYNIIISN